MRTSAESGTGESPRGDPGTPATERGRERIREDERFLPVIVKRTDEARRHPDDILQAAIDEGVEQLERPPGSLFLSAMGAGLILGFTAMSVGLVTHAVEGVSWPFAERLATALVYPLGFVICLMSGTQLFTEHTATAVYPVLDNRSGLLRLLRLWGLVATGNILGTLASSGLLTAAEPVIGARPGYVLVGAHLVGTPTLPLLASSLLAGWLMALGAWLILATPPTVSQMASIYIVTFLIGLGGLHHSIAGSAEMLTAYFMGADFAFRQGVRFVGLALLGNLAGGSLFVAGLNYAHIRRSQPQD